MFVDILFAWERNLGRFVVRSLDEPNRRAQRQQLRKIVLGSKEIGLQADADIWKKFQRATVNLKSRVHVIARFHIHPDNGILWRAFNYGFQMAETKIQ